VPDKTNKTLASKLLLDKVGVTFVRTREINQRCPSSVSTAVHIHFGVGLASASTEVPVGAMWDTLPETCLAIHHVYPRRYVTCYVYARGG